MICTRLAGRVRKEIKEKIYTNTAVVYIIQAVLVIRTYCCRYMITKKKKYNIIVPQIIIL